MSLRWCLLCDPCGNFVTDFSSNQTLHPNSVRFFRVLFAYASDVHIGMKRKKFGWKIHLVLRLVTGGI